jgi:hypothetical protein
MANGLDGLDERVAFKRIANGYVFRAPSRWLIGPAQHYLMDAAHKDEIVTALCQIRLQRARVFVMILGAAFVGLVASIKFPDHLLLVVICGIALLIPLVMLARFRQLSILQPLLADLRRTVERITWRDRLAAASTTMSLTHLFMLGLSFAVLSLANALQLIGYLHRPDDHALAPRFIITAVAVGFFACIAVANLGIAFHKMKSQAR